MYEVETALLNATDARANSTQKAGYLATITTQQENAFIHSLVLPDTEYGYWFGASDVATEGIFVWLDGPEAGLALTYQNWQQFGPNEFYPEFGGEDYVVMVRATGEWNDAGFESPSGLICAPSVIEFDTDPNASPVPAIAFPALLVLSGLLGFGDLQRLEGGMNASPEHLSRIL